ncbi:MAG: hypothetical protein SGPRY_012997, partial [Prymnesium sp.]
HELEAIRKRYDINDLGRVSYSLGARVRQNPRARVTAIDQEPYIKDIVKEFGNLIVAPGSKTGVVPLTETTLNNIIGGDPDALETAEWQASASAWEAN